MTIIATRPPAPLSIGEVFAMTRTTADAAANYAEETRQDRMMRREVNDLAKDLRRTAWKLSEAARRIEVAVAKQEGRRIPRLPSGRTETRILYAYPPNRRAMKAPQPPVAA